MRDGDPHVLVGYDGSPSSERALEWAVHEAVRRRLALTVCHAWHWPFPTSPTRAEAMESMHHLAGQLLDAGVSKARSLAPRLAVRSRLVYSSAASALLNESPAALIIVVGSRGLGGFADLRLGSAAVQVPAHAGVPVAVVKEPASRNVITGRVVVGVDGSPAGDAALAFAFEEAALREGMVRAVTAWSEYGPAEDVATDPYAPAEEARREIAARFERSVAPWREKYPQVPTETAVLDRSASVALRAAASGAELLVVGQRGYGGSPLALGRVAQTMLHHAPCSVAVVPA